ncbi:hypothetical protein [Paenibacillus planticolens]|uniref:hypothetical protein n=1 Tax=Paenibacillus planticolens TaxID=2654976 RepID=UPI00149146F5|nr:hypothetical protein [Paenibacillus planticolens]
MAANLKIKQVVFNIDDPDQKLLLQHAAQRTNFSAYIKRLIQRDMEGGSLTPVANVHPEEIDFTFNAESFI